MKLYLYSDDFAKRGNLLIILKAEELAKVHQSTNVGAKSYDK